MCRISGTRWRFECRAMPFGNLTPAIDVRRDGSVRKSLAF